MIVIKDIEEFGKLRLDMQKKLQMNLILQSFTNLYGQFIVNFYMNKLDCIIPKLINMLVTAKEILRSSRGTILTVERTSSIRRKSGWKKKNKSAKKQKKESKPKKDVPKKAETKKNIFTMMLTVTGGETV